MNFASLFVSLDGRARPIWRAALFIPTWISLLIGSFLPVFALVPLGVLRRNLETALLVQGICISISAGLAAWMLLAAADKRSFRTLGLWFYDGWAREFALGLTGGAGLISVVVAVLMMAGQVHFQPKVPDALGALHALGWGVALLMPAAAAEELLFRGYLFQRLIESWGALLAVLFLSAFFGAVHWHNPSATALSTANTVLAGVLLAVCYLKTRALWFPIGVHFAWNYAMAFIYLLPVSGIVPSEKLLAAEITGPPWLSGGSYGPEGSVVTTVVSTAAIVWLARTRRLEVSPAQAAALQ